MPTDAFTRAVADLKPLLGEYSPEHLRADAVRIVLKAYGLSEPLRWTQKHGAVDTHRAVGYALAGTLNTATDEIGPYTKQLREEADRQYPTGEEG